MRARRPTLGILVAAALFPFALSLAAAAALSSPGTDRAWERKLDPFLRRVATGTRRVRGASARAIAAASPELFMTLPPFVRRDRGSTDGAIFVKARFAPETGGPAPDWDEVHARLAPLGVELRAHVGSIASLRVPARALALLAGLADIAWIKAGRAYHLTNEVSTGTLHVASDEASLAYGTRGAGVIVAVVDSGLQWTEPDMRNTDGTSRVLAIWDQTVTDPIHPPPAGFTFGALYTKADIDAALAAAGTLLTGDGEGHGTHVAGSAAGNGRETGNGVPAGTFAGVAPEADLLIVRVFDASGTFCDACDLTAAVQFIQETAAAQGRPWVGNMSLGTDIGAHDGTDPDEQTIDAAVGPGRRGAQMAIAAGNSAQRAMHWEGGLSAGAVLTNTFNLNYTPRTGADNDFIWIDLWYSGPDRVTVEIVTPGGAVVGAAPGSESGVVCAEAAAVEQGTVQIDATNLGDAANGDNQVFIQIWDAAGCAAPVNGTWTIRLSVDSVGEPPGSFDLWNEADLGPSGLTHVSLASPIFQKSTGIPGTARHALTAASYTSKCSWLNASGNPVTACNDPGTIAATSSIGPTRDGRLKPDLAAPGRFVASSLGGRRETTCTGNCRERDNLHGNLNGTSMATPHVAGAAALALAVNPGLEGPEVRAIIVESAVGDTFTGALPNARWGHGKLRATGALALGASLPTDLRATGPAGFAATGTPFVDTWNVYRGTIPGLGPGNYGACFLTGLTSPTFSDPESPPAGTAYTYILTGVVGGVEGLLGVDGAGDLRINTAACP